jgi:glycosyltransferase involved in cell wall biosynthesis
LVRKPDSRSSPEAQSNVGYATEMVIVIVEAMDPTAPGIGGGETYSRNLVEYLLKTGVRAIFIGASPSNRRSTRDGLTFVPATNNMSFSNLGYVLRLTTSRSFALVPRGAIINVQRPEFALPFVLFCHRDNPKVITLHGRILDGVRLKQPRVKAVLYRMVESLCLKHCAAVIAVDGGTRDFYEREYPWLRTRLRVIPIGIDLARFRVMDRNALRAKWGFGDGERIVMFVGRLEIEKDLGFLIDSFRIVLRQVPNARLVFVGDGRERGRLEDMAKDLTPDRVLFMGAQKPDSMPEILNCADVSVLCSLYEGSPTTVKEALACGVPVVTAPVGDVAQIITNNLVGQIVPKDIDQYSAAIVEFLSRKDNEGTRRECVKAAAQFGFDQIGARTVKVYEELLS